MPIRKLHLKVVQWGAADKIVVQDEWVTFEGLLPAVGDRFLYGVDGSEPFWVTVHRRDIEHSVELTGEIDPVDRVILHVMPEGAQRAMTLEHLALRFDKIIRAMDPTSASLDCAALVADDYLLARKA